MSGERRAVATAAAPQAIGPYSQAIVVGDLVFLSGQIPLDPDRGRLVAGTIEEETRQVLKNLAAVLAAEGLDLTSIVKTTVYLTDLADFPRVNQTYAEFFAEPFPARATVAVAALPRGARIEIEAVAVR
ncbi:MAG: reactive intermediate/imine deaminase [Polyangiaceae bacterium UTPRO1]|jgi:2-iminobutanoate/2-iminopropanoate deaminase|nr:RidA family protein [Myxococcales bacterium]OQY68868.1 MAG: reactive intermediate/imine deaminase [Polyangiaceae bacterium UTPRO1]